MTAQDQFGEKLTLVLKALSVSRGRLAVEVAVDKSVVGRWASGAVFPSPHNLERLTHVIAARSPGFSLIDWDRDLQSLAERFGVTGLSAPAAARDTGIIDWLPLPIVNEALANVQLRGSDYEGFWRSTRRPGGDFQDMYLHDHIMLRKAENGMLQLRLGLFNVRLQGYALPLQHQLFVIASEQVSGTIVFLILNGVARHKAEVLDGISLTCMRDAGATPIAGKILLERIGDLTGDTAADDATHAEMMNRVGIVPPDAIPAHVRDHLFHDIGPTALANGGDPTLMITLAKSFARGPGFDVPRAG